MLQREGERADADAEFVRLADPYRRELLAHCYRLLGSVHDAEDLVQETYLRAWRGYNDFEGRSSLRTWLYRIATRACLTALDGTQRRVMPSGLGGPSDDLDGGLGAPLPEVAWLEPFPSAGLGNERGDPADIAVRRQSTRLAMTAALQRLPARQRAALVLRDVLAWRAAEVAELLDVSTAAVNSALQRARAQLARLVPLEDETSEPDEAASRLVLDQYMTAFADGDVASLVSLLRADVELEMPPIPTWFAGRPAVGRFYASHAGVSDAWRALPTGANGQPAAGVYRREGDSFVPHSIHVLTVVTGDGHDRGQIARLDIFVDATLFGIFGLPHMFPLA